MKLMVKIGNHDGAILLANGLPCDEFSIVVLRYYCYYYSYAVVLCVLDSAVSECVCFSKCLGIVFRQMDLLLVFFSYTLQSAHFFQNT